MTARPSAVRDTGFTLVELLVVVAVLGLLTILISSTLKSATMGWKSISARNAETSQRQAVSDFLRQQLSQIYPESIGIAIDDPVRFQGDSNQVAFLAPLQQRFGAADIAKFVLSFSDDGTFGYSWALDRDASFPQQLERLLEGVSGGAIDYFGATDDEKYASWHSIWINQPTLPSLIRIRFVWKQTKQEIIVAPKITAKYVIQI